MSSPVSRSKSWRCHVTIPGRLAKVLPSRWAELHYPNFSPYGVELVCYDLRKRAKHDLTLRFANDTSAAQDAIDCAIAEHFFPGMQRNGLLFQHIFGRTQQAAAAANRATHSIDSPGQIVAHPMWVFFPGVLREIIEQRWRELGCPGLSSYVTGLIRYDLMLGGPHGFDGRDKHPDLLAALDAGTLTAFHARKRRRILFDYLLEQAAGRDLTDEERKHAIEKLVSDLLTNAIRSQKAARKAG